MVRGVFFFVTMNCEMAQVAYPKVTKLGKTPVVVLPLSQWKKIEDMLEDLEMLRSENFKRSIAKARAEVKAGKGLTLAEVKKRLKLR